MVVVSAAIVHDMPVLVYANTIAYAYDSSKVRSLLPSHWSMTCLCKVNITVPSPYNHVVIGHSHHHIAVSSAHGDPLVSVSLLNDLAAIHY